MLPDFLKKGDDEKYAAENDFSPNATILKNQATENGTLIFYFLYGSYFGGEAVFLIIDQGDKKCRVYARGYNGFDLNWNFVMPIAELKYLIKVLQPARKWVRNYEVQAEIYDGYGWDLIFSGKEYMIKTGGYMANPRNYFRVANKIVKQLIIFKNTYVTDDVHEEILPINGWYNAGTKS